MTGKIKIDVPGIYFKCKDKGIYSAKELFKIREEKCSRCGECWREDECSKIRFQI
jgi:TPP-dependent indolepyruvate ferredoxin oxidoreductase alpha subunit